MLFVFWSKVACRLSCFSRIQLFVTLWTAAHQASLSMGFSRQEYWSGLPFPIQRIFPTQGLNRCLLCLLHWQAGSLPLALPVKPWSKVIWMQILDVASFHRGVWRATVHGVTTRWTQRCTQAPLSTVFHFECKFLACSQKGPGVICRDTQNTAGGVPKFHFG